MQQTDFLDTVWQHKRLVLSGLVIAIVAFLCSHYSFLKITVGGASDGEVSYRLHRQGSSKTTEFKSSSKTISRLVARGSYEVTASQSGKTGFVVAGAGGWLRRVSTQPLLQLPQQHRFVGDNPDPCTFYDGTVLFSAECGGLYSKLKLHQPASGRQASFTRVPAGSSPDGVVEGIVKTSEGNVLLMQRESDEEASAQVAYLLGSGLSLDDGVALTELEPSKTYGLKPYREGFLVYDESFKDLLYYSSRNAKPETVNITKPKDGKQSPHSLEVYGNTIVVSYSNNSKGETKGLEENSRGVVSAVVIVEDGQAREYSFKLNVTQTVLCAEHRLCLLTTDGLRVYDVSGKKARHLYTVDGVDSISLLGSKLLAVRDHDLLALAVESQNGYQALIYEGYDPCGLGASPSSAVLCLINQKNDKVAVLLEPSQAATDNLEHKLNELLDVEGVKSISVYNNSIYFSLNLGQLVFNSEIGEFDYDPARRRSTVERVNNAIDNLGIDRSRYQIIIFD